MGFVLCIQNLGCFVKVLRGFEMHLGGCTKNCIKINTTYHIFTKYNTPKFEVQMPPVNMRYLHASYFLCFRCSSRSTLGILRQSKFQNILIIGFRASRRIDKQKCYRCHSETKN